MELETQKTSLKDSINELKVIVNKLSSEFTSFKVETNAKLDSLENKLNNVVKLNNLKV